MSSCDSVSPTTFGAGAEHSEGVTYTPHKGSRQPLALGDHPYNWRAIVPRTELLGLFGLVSEWPRASRSSSHVGGMSGHSLLLCWWLSLGWACWWLSGSFGPWKLVRGVVFCLFSLSGDAVQRTGISAGIPLFLLGLRFLAPEAPSRRDISLLTS